MEFKDILKAIMAEKDLKQADLCRMTNIPTSLMSNYLSGIKSPALSNSKLIASALDVSLDVLSGKEPIYESNNNFAIDPAARQLLEERKILASKSSKATLEQLKQMNKIMDALFGEKDYDD
jgi:transcriptional regulator with XRE-family HTH domain